MKHTNAPWTISQACREYNKELMITGKDDDGDAVHVCQVTTTGRGNKRSIEDYQDANALLIAAAPDLLAALEGMVKTFRAGSQDEDGDHPAVVEALSAISRARHNAEITGLSGYRAGINEGEKQ